MRRTDRQQDRDFSLGVIDRCSHGVVAISTGEDTPYCLPLSLVRVENRLYFHCAKEGRKIQLLRQNPRVCVTFVGADAPDFVPPAVYVSYYQSAIVTGTAKEVLDPEEKIAALRALCQKLTPSHMDGFDKAIETTLGVTAVWCIEMDEITGKAKKESP